MDRKSFLQAFVPATAGILLSKKLSASPGRIVPSTVPPYLKRGDTIAITCPAGAVETSDLRSCNKVLESWGINIKYGKTIGKKWLRYAGTDEERLQDLQALLDDDSVNAILFGRGGYGAMRIIDKVNWEKFRERPKWLIGYSDITTIHLHVHNKLGIPTIHGDMSTGLSTKPGDASTKSLEETLFGKPVAYVVKGNGLNREGNCSGILIGGNLSLLQACSGSESDITTAGKILFIEDVNEYKYCIDRMLVHLKRSGKLDKLAGLIVGGFTATKEKDEEDYKQTIEELVWEKVKEYNYPVCFNFPAGHIKDNLALKLGVPYELSVSVTDVIMNEKLSS
jgi:muramoyltetrapeptide carboxypeptidase